MSDGAMPMLKVHLDDPDTGALSWKAAGRKGARWKKARSIDDACHQADAVLPTPRIIDYVSRKD